MRLRIPFIFAAVTLLFSALLAGCTKELSPAEKFVRSRLPGELRQVVISPDGDTICGEIGDARSGRFVRFYSRWKQQALAYEGTEDFSVRAHAQACGLALCEAGLAAEEARYLQSQQEHKAALARASRGPAPPSWLEQNGEAIQALHEAANRLQSR